MAKNKSPSKALTRLFDRTVSPVYIVNSNYEITYANQACADWTGVDLDSLIFSKCTYASQPGLTNGTSTNTQTANLLQGLCPPPGVIESYPASQQTPGPLAIFITPNSGEKIWRQSSMLPLFDDAQNAIGVLVVCGDSNLGEPPTSDPTLCSNDSAQLHAALARIRTATDQIHSLESLVGTSPFAKRLRRQVQTAIDSKTDVLIVGPAGCGKEHLAKTIHSTRATNDNTNLIPIYGSVTDQSQIQQTIKDIVTNHTATSIPSPDTKRDWLLLIDVDKLNESAQNELLGFIELPNFTLPIIATSSESLIEKANAGKYSPDLAHHLSVMTIEVVPLAQRPNDIPFLAQALLERNNFRRDQQIAGFSKQAMQNLIEFHWPENIDQLNRVVQAAAQKSNSTQIEEQDLPDAFVHAFKALRIGKSTETEIQLDQYLNDIERQLVVRALKQAKGNKTKAAKLLGISRAKLLRRLQFFELIPQKSQTETPDTDQLDSSAFEELD